MATRVQCKREASRTRRAIAADHSAWHCEAGDDDKRESHEHTCLEVACDNDKTNKDFFSERNQTTERETRIDTPSNVGRTKKDHAVTKSRDASLRYEGGHSPDHHTVALEKHRWAAEATTLANQTSHTAEHVVVNYLPVDRGHQPRTINHEGRNAEWKSETSHVVVTYHKVTLKKKHRRNHCQRASGEREWSNATREYEDSEKNTKNWSNDEKNREEQSQQQAEEQSQQQAE